MSGHSKWATIRRKKEKTDGQRGKVFTKISRELMVAAKEGGPDPATNVKLRDVIAKAKSNNIPNDNIQRFIKKASGEDGNVNYEEVVYEGYGIGGVAVIVEAMTDNRNRTASDVRHYFDKYGGAMGATGCVGWMFDRKGLIVLQRSEGMDDDEMMLQVLEAGAEDFAADEETYEITTDPAEFSAVREALENQGLSFISANIERIPQNTVKVDEEAAEKIYKLLDMLEDCDDVQNVYHNGEMPEE